MTDAVAPLQRRFDTEMLAREARSAEMDATVVVQAVSDEDETRALLDTAERSSGLVRGVVGWTDLTLPGVDDRIGALWDEPGGQRLVGLRHQVHDEADPEWLLRPQVQQSIGQLATLGLTFDLLVRPRELPAAVETVRRHQHVTFIVDHAAKPAIGEQGWQPWASRLEDMAREPNTLVKLSGLVTEASWRNWSIDHLLPYAEHVLAAFGPSRVMFGSDWPVCTLAATYREVVDIAARACSGLSASERNAVFGGTAVRAYGLGADA